MSGIPTARNVDHYAFTVPDLDEAVTFFTDVLGAGVAYRMGPVDDPNGDWMTRQLGVHPRASAHIAMLRLGPVTNIELFEYDSPDHCATQPRNCDVGGHHLGFYVDDVDAAVDYLRRQKGVTILGVPQTMPDEAPNAGDRWVYFLTPWGMQMEVHNVPAYMPYQQHAAVRRFGPCSQWTVPEEGTPASGGIPTVRNVDHGGYTVADLDVAVDFFVNVLGAHKLYEIGPIELDSEFMATQLNVPGAGTIRQALLRLGPTDNLELFEYGVEGAATQAPSNSDVGGNHLAFCVDDVDAAADYLARQPGVRILGEPQTITEGPIAGDRWLYFQAPFGMSLEVLNMPDGAMPYEQQTPIRRRSAHPGTWTDQSASVAGVG